ncbi:DUF6401 family natural product biosynthesis protein [Nocardia sp. CA-107356]|uniref:DUF6401 family natural product biosynthesis protein n=1 Tax=Nocardia sp. CA-107356 TaxID=3239972 RepID=UPI003D89E514
MLLEGSARRTLNRLHKTHGVPALAAAADLPGLSTALDQHAAAVRDLLEHGIEASAGIPTSVLLAGYARGLLDQARDTDLRPTLPRETSDPTDTDAGLRRTPPTDVSGWRNAGWLPLRLAGVCLHANNQQDRQRYPSRLDRSRRLSKVVRAPGFSLGYPAHSQYISRGSPYCRYSPRPDQGHPCVRRSSPDSPNHAGQLAYWSVFRTGRPTSHHRSHHVENIVTTGHRCAIFVSPIRQGR